MPEPLHFTDAEKSAFRSTYAPTASDDQFAIFINECQRRALVPGVHVVFNLRDAKEYNRELKQSVYVKRVALITTINALRLIAERTGHYDGHGPFIYYYGQESGDLKESKIPLGKVPHAVSVEGFRKDWKHPLFATARYDAYVQLKDDGGKKVPTLMWSSRGEEQLAKCAEAQMLRTVAPEECAGLLIDEELGNGVIDKEDVTSVTSVVLPQPIIAPPVNQAPAPPVEPKPQPVPERPAQAVPTPEPGSLFTSTNRPLPEQETRAFPPIEPPPPPPAPASPVQSTDAPADLKTFNDLTSRAAKVVRDKLPKSGMKEGEASALVKNYLLKASGSTSIRAIGAKTLEKIIQALESGTPEDAAAIVRAAK